MPIVIGKPHLFLSDRGPVYFTPITKHTFKVLPGTKHPIRTPQIGQVMRWIPINESKYKVLEKVSKYEV